MKQGYSPLHQFMLKLFAVMVLASAPALAQTCLSAEDLDAATRSTLVTTAQRYFAMAAEDDAASLRQNSIPSLAADFSGIETAIKDHQADFAGAPAKEREPFLLKADGAAPLERAEFLCGVFGSTGQTANSAVIVIPNLPPGNYALVTLDVASKEPATVSFVLEKQGAEWKLGGFYVKSTQVAGHDGKWYADQARVYKAKGQTHNAWLYFMMARDLISPVSFLSTRTTDQLYDEAQGVQPADLPTNGPIDLAAGGKTYKLTQVFPQAVGNDLDLVVKYQTADVSNTQQTFQDNMAVMRALVAKFPELRNAFAGIVARAVAPNGQDYGSLLAMKDVK